MSYKIATYTTLLLIVVLASVFFYIASGFTTLRSNQPVSPATFPQIVSVLLVVMSIVSFITTRRQKDEKVELPNFRYVIYTIIAIIVFTFLWEAFGYFYPLLILLLAVLFYLYDDNSSFKRKILTSIILAFVVGTLIYVVFATLLNVVF